MKFEEFEKLVEESDEFKALGVKEKVAMKLRNRLFENENCLQPYVQEWIEVDDGLTGWANDIWDAYVAYKTALLELENALGDFVGIDTDYDTD